MELRKRLGERIRRELSSIALALGLGAIVVGLILPVLRRRSWAK